MLATVSSCSSYRVSFERNDVILHPLKPEKDILDCEVPFDTRSLKCKEAERAEPIRNKDKDGVLCCYVGPVIERILRTSG